MTKYTIVIDEDVPLARKTRNGNTYVHPLSWLLTKLKVGQSFIYPASTGERANRLRSIANGHAKRLGIKIATRTVTDRDGVDRVRFWRTE